MYQTTIVIPCYKAGKTIAKAVSSIIDTQKLSAKIIIIEDGVFDDTQKIVNSLIAKYGEQISLYTLTQNKGAQHARNLGLSKVETETVMFLDSDDYVSEGFIDGLHYALSSTSSSIAFGNMYIYSESGELLDKRLITQYNNEAEILNSWLQGRVGPHPCSIMWKTSEVSRIGGWLEGMSRNQDGEIIIRALCQGCTVTLSAEGYGAYCNHDGSRLSKVNSKKSFVDQIAIINAVKCRSAHVNYNYNPALATFSYLVSFGAYKSGYEDIGAEWEIFWKSYRSKFCLIKKTTWKLKVAEVLSLFIGIKSISRIKFNA